MTARRRHVEEAEEAEGNGERWLLTYADMITLLLALFIVLFAVSTINSKKFLALAAGFQQAFNPNPGILPSSNGLLANASLAPTTGVKIAPSIAIKTIPNTTTPSTTTPNNTTTPNTTTTPNATTTPPASAGAPGQQPLAKIQAEINQALVAKGLQQDASTAITQEGLVVQILSDHVFYATDVANLNATGNEVVDTIASVLRTDTNDVDVEGYTDNAPIYGGPYTTNMELSAERAVNVVVRLYKVDGLTESRLASIGYGSTHPLVPNTTPANMAENRRVDVVILAPGQAQP